MRTLQYYVNPKTRLCRVCQGPQHDLDSAAAEALAQGFIPATAAEVDAFRKVTEQAIQQGWKPERMRYDTWLKVRTYNPEPAEVRKAKAATALQAERESDYQTWYEEAMVASNEAGFAGVSAAQTIRDLDSDNARLTRERDQALAERNDAQQLLAKYRQHVEDCESIDFLDRIGTRCSDVTFTPAERTALFTLRDTPETDHD